MPVSIKNEERHVQLGGAVLEEMRRKGEAMIMTRWRMVYSRDIWSGA